MRKLIGVDARHEQLKLLKFERRTLRPMAIVALDKSFSKKAKIAAIAGVSAAFFALQSVSIDYVEKLGVSQSIANESAAVVSQVCSQCSALAGMIDRNAGEVQIRTSLANLFSLIDSEHERLERVGISVGARLVGAARNHKAVGTGGKETNESWLTLLVGDGDGKDVGTGGKETNLTWLSQLKA